MTLLVLLFASSTSYSQLQQLNTEKPKVLGKVGSFQPTLWGWNPFVASLEYYSNDSGTKRYILTYNDITYKQLIALKSISFKATDDELNSLYDLFKARVDEKKGAETTLKIGEDTVLIVTKKFMGMDMIYLSVLEKGGMFALCTKTLNQLFGRD